MQSNNETKVCSKCGFILPNPACVCIGGYVIVRNKIIWLRGFNSWVCGEDIGALVADFKKRGKKYGMKKFECVMDVFEGTQEDIDKIEISDMGDLRWPKTLTHVQIICKK